MQDTGLPAIVLFLLETVSSQWSRNTYKVRMPAIASGIAIGKDKAVLLKLTLDSGEVKVVLHEDVRQTDRVTVGTWSVLNVTNRV